VNEPILLSHSKATEEKKQNEEESNQNNIYQSPTIQMPQLEAD